MEVLVGGMGRGRGKNKGRESGWRRVNRGEVQ